MGALRLVHDEQGVLVAGEGVWIPRGEGLGYHDLLELLRPGVALLYAGPAWEGSGDGDPDQVTIEVEVDAVERERQPGSGPGEDPGGSGGPGLHERTMRAGSSVRHERSGTDDGAGGSSLDGKGAGRPLVRFRLSPGERDGPGR